ncbi:sigma-70 family RNA polymerase sigma factor [Dyella solisilvae]|uniref:sigma-70 family RNA polymerase sigma factor n=1 Tax=Dyella solisilvae TaxID=1920168 RepID=UPI001314A6FE|nr:sigma-70 family RNA polymerase sigma factor [Dyella solisilvae]
MDATEDSLWGRWQSDRDASTRDALVARYSPWARQVARGVYMRVYRLREAWEDCTQNALIGLMEAIDRYQPGRGVSFEAYARHRVRGAVFNGLRVMRDDLVAGRRPSEHAATLRERVQSLGEDEPEDPLDAFASMTVGLGLGFLLEASSFPGATPTADAYASAERAQLTDAVTLCVERLTAREQSVIVMHYFHHVPFVQIAEDLKLTKGRVSQLHKQALGRLRALLGDDAIGDF